MNMKSTTIMNQGIKFLQIFFCMIMTGIVLVACSSTYQPVYEQSPSAPNVREVAAAPTEYETSIYESYVASSYQVGSIIEFSGIDWRVLDVQSDRILIITEDILMTRSFHPVVHQHVTWSDSDLRHYLNNNFFNSLMPWDRSRVLLTQNANDDNPVHGTSGGFITNDRIFLLSFDEVVRYFGGTGELSDSEFRVHLNSVYDEYNVNRMAFYYVGDRGSGLGFMWYLRTPGNADGFISFVFGDGIISLDGMTQSFELAGIRPALWLSMVDADSETAGPTPELPRMTSENFEYQFSEEWQGIEITRYLGSDLVVYIPAEIDGIPVKSIGWIAFSNLATREFDGLPPITHVNIPYGVVNIGEAAFR